MTRFMKVMTRKFENSLFSKLLRFIIKFSRTEVSNFDKVSSVREYRSWNMDDVFG